MANVVSTPLKLPTALYTFVGLGAMAFAAVTANVVRQQAETFQQDALTEAVFMRTHGAAISFARALDRDWTHLQEVRDQIPIGNPA